MSKTDEPYAYFLNDEQNSRARRFAIGPLDYVKEIRNVWIKGKSEKNRSTKKKVSSETENFSQTSALTDALSSALDFGFAQSELIDASFLIKDIFPDIYTKINIIDPTIKKSALIDDLNGYKIYQLNQSQYRDHVSKREKIKQIKDGTGNFPIAILLSLIASFDGVIVDIIKSMLKLRKDWIAKSERKFDVSSIKEYNNLNDLIDDLIAEELYIFSRGSHEEQAIYINSKFDVNINKENWERWPEYIEIFERRNLVAHGNMYFNKRYVAICKKSGHVGAEMQIGKKIELNKKYLLDALDVLLEFSVLLAFCFWRKFERGTEDQAFINLNEAVYTLIRQGRPIPAHRLAEFALKLNGAKYSEETRLRLTVNMASALRHSNCFEEARVVLNLVDWSSSDSIFKVCVAALLDDIDRVEKLLTKLFQSNELSEHNFAEWPCFGFIRNHPRIKALLGREFGEEILESATNLGPGKTQETLRGKHLA